MKNGVGRFTEEWRRRVSDGLKKKYRLDAEYRAKVARNLKAALARSNSSESRRKAVAVTIERWRVHGKNFSAAGLQASKENGRRTGRLLTGKLKIGGKTGRGPDNVRSLEWRFMSPDGSIVEGRNLNDLVRKNAHLFDSSDLKVKSLRSGSCLATVGLFTIARFGTHPAYRSRTWKGWRAMVKQDVKKYKP